MIDPDRLTKFDRSRDELAELLLFCPLAAARSGHQAAAVLAGLLHDCGWPGSGPPEAALVRRHGGPGGRFRRTDGLARHLKALGMGLSSQKARALAAVSVALSRGDLDPAACTADRLERLPYFGMKTSRLFLLHSRADAGVACLDVHLLRWLERELPGEADLWVRWQARGRPWPASTPGRADYLVLEGLYLELCRRRGAHPAALDLEVWRALRRPAACA